MPSQFDVCVSPSGELRHLLEEEILPAHRAQWGAARSWDANLDFQRALARYGWTAPGWPVERGGLGLSVTEQLACAVVLHELDVPPRVAVYGVNNVGPTIIAWGTPEQQRHLHGIITVDELWCQGFSEPDHGSDLAGLRTRADRSGNDFVINGQKTWTSIGMYATHCMVLARTDQEAPKHRGISTLLVPLDTPGITRKPIRQMNGAAEFAELFFDDVCVPSSALLGPFNEGWKVTMTTLGHERAGVLAMAVQLAMDAERIVRDLPATGAGGGALRDRGIRILTEAQVLRWTGQRLLAAEVGAPDHLSPLIKLAWSNLGQRLRAFAVDSLGIASVAGTAELPHATRLAASPSYSIAGGTTEVLKNIIAERVLQLPKTAP